MYLKRVELYGFKSFADRTSFDMAAGITAVLGPNGCGKSNVVDAIKWVLGESSAKNLRGTQMQDVIFAGAQGRKPLGMAEVSLVFDNADNALPLAFGEIAVTRRLYRSGDSEYEINKQPCRRRDIRDLFLDTGVGMSAYSFIEQGRVEALLQAKPEERRLVLEEAAGVSKYKVRRKESLARLERTNQSLLRVNDLVEELEKNIKRVSRQAGNAKRHQQLAADLRAGKTLHYTRLATTYLAQLSAGEKEKASGENLFAQKNSRQTELAQMITGLTGEELALQEKVEQGEREYRALQTALNQIQIELATAAEKRENLTATQQEATQRAAALREKLTALAAAETAAQTALAAAEAELAEYQKILDEQDSERNERQRQLDECEQKIAALRDAALTIAERRSEIRAAEAQASARAADGAARLREHLLNEEALRRRERELGAEKSEWQQKYDAAKNNFTALNERVTAARENEKQARLAAEREVAALAERQQKLSALRSRHATLQELADAHDGAFGGVKAALLAKERGQIGDLLGMVADILQVPPEYATAIETALGGAAQDLITRTAAGAQECIQYLKQNRAGRATFLPLDRISPRPPLRDEVLRQAGVVGEAFDLVDFADEYERAVAYLLNGVLIVRDLTTARELAGGAARGVRLVTLDGEVISPHGAMTGGQGNQQRGGLIARNAEKDALARQIADLAAQLAAGEATRQSYAEKVATSERERAELEAELTREIQTGGALERELSVKNSEHQRAIADVANFDAVKIRLENASAAFANDRENFAAEKASLAAREQATTTEIQATLTAQKSARENLDALGNSLAGGRERRGAASGAVNEWSRRLQECATNQREIAAELTAREAAAGAAASDHAAVQTRLSALKAQEVELLAKRDATGDAGDKEQLRDLRERLERLRGEEKEAQSAANAAYQTVNAAQVKISELNVRLETVAEKARAELGLEDLAAVAREHWREPVFSAATGEALIEPQTPIMIEDTDINTLDDAALADLVQALSDKIARLGPVNMYAIEELAELEARAEFYQVEREDIQAAADDLLSMIEKFNRECDRKFAETFEKVKVNFQEMFTYLFGGGQAELVLAEPLANEGERGIEIIARPPGKSPKSISLLSGGEKALCAVALLFAIFRCKPSPFCILDEVDGPLDESNIDRFMEAVRKFTADTQFIIISHSKRTMSMVDTIYGVTQEQPGVSTRYSLQFTAAPRDDAA
ncbi:MAG: chromosome segregation protein SMC [Planctomycetota bacterium]|jgi:chromosome segregation protein|nr:chromosome segregation protein SMC [Planctomycetota bacterium]